MDHQPPPPLDQNTRDTNAWPSGRVVRFCLGMGVVLAVGLLIFPAIAMLRNSANSTTCQNNLRQIGLAIHSYHDGNNGRFPTICDHGAGNGHGFGVVSLQVAIIPYVEGG